MLTIYSMSTKRCPCRRSNFTGIRLWTVPHNGCGRWLVTFKKVAKENHCQATSSSLAYVECLVWTRDNAFENNSIGTGFHLIILCNASATANWLRQLPAENLWLHIVSESEKLRQKVSKDSFSVSVNSNEFVESEWKSSSQKVKFEVNSHLARIFTACQYFLLCDSLTSRFKINLS